MTTVVLEQQGKTRFESKTVTFQAILEPKQEIGLTTAEEDCESSFDLAPTFLPSFASRLQSDAERSESASSLAPKESHLHRRQRPTVFHGSKSTPIPIGDYVWRIAEHSKCSHVCFVAAYWYMQRLSKVDSKYRLCRRSVHRLLISSVLVAAKLLDDKFYSNAFYARIGGISTKELNKLELEMLQLLDFRVYANHSVLRACLADILGEISSKPVSPPQMEDCTCGDGVGRKRANEDPLADCTCGAGVGRKRVNEDPSADTAIPAKFQHSTGTDQVLVMPKESQALPKPKSAGAVALRRGSGCGSWEGHPAVTATVLRASIDVGGS